MLCLPPSSPQWWPCASLREQGRALVTAQHGRTWKFKYLWNPSMGCRGNGLRKQWIMLRGLRGKQGTLKVTVQTCPEGTAQILIRIHGRLWPCGARSEGEYSKPGIFRAYNFSSEAKGTSANLELRVPYSSLSLCIARAGCTRSHWASLIRI